MTLLAPAALWLSAVGAAVVALYLLKVKLRPQVVPSLEFWRLLSEQTHVRSLFRRLKRWLSLLLWLVIVAGLVGAAANPVLTAGRVKPESRVLILDNSASMMTVEDAAAGLTRFDQAKTAVRDIVERRGVADEWLLLEAAAQPRVLQSWTRRRADVLDAVDALRPRPGSADRPAAVELARQLLEGRPRPRIVLITDSPWDAAEAARLDVLSIGVPTTAPPGGDAEVPSADGAQPEAAPPKTPMTVWSVGATDDNRGITVLSARVHRQQSAHHVFARVFNASAREASVQLVLELDGSTSAVEPVRIGPRSHWEKVLVFDSPTGGVLRAYLDGADALQADDQAFAILEPVAPARITLVTPASDAFFFEQALRAMDPLVDAAASLVLTPEQFDAAAGSLPPPDLTVVNNALPQRLPAAGAFVFVNVCPADLPARRVETLDHPKLTITDERHPLTRYLTVHGVALTRATRVDLTGAATVLAEAADGSPLIFHAASPRRQALCLTFNVLDSDLPFRNAFPILLRNAVTFLVKEQTRWLQATYQPGATVTPLRPLPPEVTQVRITRPGRDASQAVTLPVRDASFAWTAGNLAGPVRFDFDDQTAFTAVNLTDEGETDIRVAGGADKAADELGLSKRLLGTVPWLALAMLSAGLIALEWMTYHYRWTE